MVYVSSNLKSLKEQLLLTTLAPYIKFNHPKTAESIIVPTESAVFYHTGNEEELLFIIGGAGGMTINGEGFLIKSGDMLYIPPHSIRSLANIELEPLQVISIK